MSKGIRLPVLVLCIASVAALAQQSDTPATKDDILKLFRVMNTEDQMKQVMQQVIQEMAQMDKDAMQKRHPTITQDDLAQMDREFKEVAQSYPVDQLMDDMIPVYQKHLTKADVDAMIAFYSSPTGKKLLRDMPAMTSEGIQAAYPRLQRNLDEIMKRMDEKAPASPSRPDQ